MALLLLLASCSAPPRSTRMTADDFEHMGAEMAASLVKSPALAERNPQSPPWIVSIAKVQNLSNDVMTESEQWLVIARVRDSVAVQALRESKNLHFVIPPERLAAMRNDPNLGRGVGEVGPAFGAQRQPTHLLNATFRSATRVNAEGTSQSELYYCEFELLDLKGAVPVWTDKVEYKRVGVGHIWD